MLVVLRKSLNFGRIHALSNDLVTKLFDVHLASQCNCVVVEMANAAFASSDGLLGHWSVCRLAHGDRNVLS